MTTETSKSLQIKNDEEQAFDTLLAYIHRERGIDFNQYKRSFLRRRLIVRKRARGVDTYQAYQDILRSDSSEFDALLNALRINVSYFFRNQAAFDALRKEVVIPLIKQRDQDRQRRLAVWSAGCAGGEEPYSIAIMLTDLLGSQFPRWNIRIYATDIDAGALVKARKGIYKPASFRNLKADFVSQYFSKQEGQYVLHPYICKMVSFRQRALSDPATLSQYDLILCRNVLIYYSSDHQKRIIQLLFGQLKMGGCLMLGMAEMLPQSFCNKLEAVNGRLRIFRKPTGQEVL
ncbi:MAG: protein-glutamate O-methyltransferase CheR [Chloroflexota bacterium]|nr:protein-glutamate O-methyltransferase CheR [Chloroflexota bacterium]